MRGGDTTWGGAQRKFPETAWSMVVRLGASATREHRAGLEELCRRYWRPVYHYLRVAWSKSNEDAKDLTQSFFVWLLEGDALEKYSPERGGFRTYLKIILRSFANHERKALGRLKRGGGRRIVPLEDGAAEAAASGAETPEQAFDRAWTAAVLDRAVTRLQAWHESKGEGEAFRTFAEHIFSDESQRPTYAALAERLGMKESDVRNRLHAFRERIREEVRNELAELTADTGELEEEWNAFLSS